MSKIKLVNHQLFLSNETSDILLLDFEDFFHNKSRLPMHAFGDNNDTMFQFIISLIQENKQLFRDYASFKNTHYITLDCIILSKLMQFAAPIKVAEFGCTRGEISYNLTEVIGKLNPKSSLWLISNTIGNDSGNNCLNLITQATHFPELSMIYCDYTETLIAEKTFDIVIINGDIDYADPYKVIKEAERITKDTGTLICYSPGNYLLESSFKLVFSERQEYPLTPSDVILVANNASDSWSGLANKTSLEDLPTLIKSIENEIFNKNSIDSYRLFIKQIDQYINAMITEYNIPKKLQLIQLKEAILDYITNFDTCYYEFYKNVLLSQLNDSH